MRSAILVLVGLLAAGPLAAQDTGVDDLSLGQVQSPILILDVERLFAESALGQAVRADLAAQVEQLAAENRRIEAAMTAEEQSLTERRPAMEPAAFEALANDFDQRAQAIRADQDAKERALRDALGAVPQDFLQRATPILGQLMLDSGASVILDRRTVFLATGAIDVTDQAIAALDAALGDGQPDDGQTPP